MENLIIRFPSQLTTELETRNLSFPERGNITNVVVLGMGGSGIGGRMVADMVAHCCGVPIIVVNNYDIPHFVNAKSLVVASSYSGNTEETLEAFGKAAAKGAQLACITSGGKMQGLAEAAGHPLVLLPSGYPAPRACLGFSMRALLGVLEGAGLIDGTVLADFEASAAFLIAEQEDIRAKTARIAFYTAGKALAFYAEEGFGAVLVRIAQQVNENAKQLAIHHVVPEMNHNEIVGWESNHNDTAVIYLRNKGAHPKNQLRMEIMKETIRPNAASIIEVVAKGSNDMERLMYALHFGDFLSLEMSKIVGVDVMAIASINHLKGELARLT